MVLVYCVIRRPHKKITASSLEKGLQVVVSVSLIVVFVVAAMPAPAPEDSVPAENGAGHGDLLTAAATIMGLTVFGSALGTLGSSRNLNKDLIKGIAYTLVPIVVVQAAFMLGVMDIIHFPVVVWIPMTAILLMVAVLAMAASRLLSDKDDGNATDPAA